MTLLSCRMRRPLADIGRRRGRALLVILGIFIGVFGLTAVNVTQDAIIQAFTFAQGINASRPDVTLTVDRLDPSALPALQALQNVHIVQYQSQFQTQWRIKGSPGHTTMVITSFPDPRHVPLTPFQLTSGRYPDNGEVIMEYSDLTVQQFGLGDTITVDTPSGTAALTVVGVARTPGVGGSTNAQAYMSAAGLRALVGSAADPQDLNGASAFRNLIKVKVYDTRQSRYTADTLQSALRQRGVRVFDSFGSAGGPDPATIQSVNGVFTLLRLLALLAVVMSVFLLVTTISTLVTEQMPVIGTMKAVGGTWAQITRDYMITIGVYSVLGTIAGIGLGLVGGFQLALLLAPQVPLDIGPFVLEWWIVALSLCVGLIVPLLAAFVPLWNGTRVSVRAALAAPGVGGGHEQSPLARVGRYLPWVRQTTWLGLRGLFRRRLRATMALLTVAIAGACFLVVQTTAVSINDTIAATQNRFDFDVSIFAGQSSSFQQTRAEIAQTPNINRIERYGQTNEATRWGTVQVLGYEPDTQLYHYQLTSGRWMRPDDTNVVLLSDDVAHKTGLRIGDPITLSGGVTLTVIGTLKQHIDTLGWIGAIVTDVNTVNLLNGVPAANASDTAIWVAVQANDRSSAAVEQLAFRLDAAMNSSGVQSKGNPNVASVQTHHSIVARRESNWYVLYYLLYAVAAVVGFAGSVGLANALAASALERQREIGMMRAMGASGRQVACVFWIEGLALGAGAWLVGALVGIPLAYAFVAEVSALVEPVDFHAAPIAFVVMLVAIWGIATAASVIPSWRASRVRVADMLRYE